MNKLVEDRLKKRPKTKGYHPNAAPYKVIVHNNYSEPFIKREYKDKDKAERYAMELSLKHPKWKITIECIRLPSRKDTVDV